ncbi:MAG: hypothetical protein Q8N44_01545, partial [Rubrivivax sp.]|nr:hypothetical protein [Rubrivivax sp.]
APASVATGPCSAWQDALELADRGRLVEAGSVVQACLQRRAQCANAHALAGDLHLASDHLEAARTSLQRALYLRPDHAGATAAMLALARRRGDGPAIDTWRARVQRVQAPDGAPIASGACGVTRS